MVGYFLEAVARYPENIAYEFYGYTCTYREMYEKIRSAAKALKAQGVNKGDRVTICMPNTPEAIISFYALNKIGSIANMVHPLSAQNEIKHYLKISESVAVLTIDLAYDIFKRISCETMVKNIIVATPSESMPKYMKVLYRLTQPKVEVSEDKNSITWNDFIKLGKKIVMILMKTQMVSIHQLFYIVVELLENLKGLYYLT